MAGNGIVVWEWQNEFGCWRPYDPTISGFIETNKSSAIPLKLGSVDPSLYLYEIDLQTKCQVRQGTGTQRPIRRTVHPLSSPLAKGITWQWEGDILGHWNDFDVEVIQCLEDCFSRGQTFIDLTVTRVGLPYHIDLSKMTQTRVHTGRVRKIQRVFTSSSYPLDLSASSSSSLNNKRSSFTALNTKNKNAVVKRPKTVSNSVNTPPASTASTAGGPFLNTGFNMFPSSSTASSFNGFPNPVSYNPSGSGSTLTSIPSPVIQFGQAQGPLTRSRYNHTLAAMNLQGGLPVMQQSQTLPSTNVPSNNNLANLNIQGPGSSYSNPHFPNPPGFIQSLFTSQNQSGSHGGFGGLPAHNGPSSHFGFTSNSGPSLHQPLSYPQPGNLNPSGVFGGTRNGRIRPSVSRSQRLPQSHERIPNIEKSSKNSNKNVPTSNEILENYAVLLNNSPADEDCCICCEKLQEASGHGTGTGEDHAVIQLEKCSHMFHKLCLQAMYDSGHKEGSLQCPTCKTIYGEKRGNCPAGEMEYHVINTELPGHERHKTIQVTYHIPSGTQGPEHPHPGKRYSTRGFPRVGYIPDSEKGRKVLQLLLVAWKRRLTFTIGTSATTGEDDTVVWNEIHHKTELGTNYSGHGYPDPKFLDNVLLELAVHGITEKDLPT